MVSFKMEWMSQWFVSLKKNGGGAIKRNDFAHFDRRRKRKNNYLALCHNSSNV